MMLRFIAAGAKQVACFDRFQPLKNTPFHHELYRCLREQLSPHELRKLDSANGNILHYRGSPFERAACSPSLSRSVLS